MIIYEEKSLSLVLFFFFFGEGNQNLGNEDQLVSS